jgi:hypothetical protein
MPNHYFLLLVGHPCPSLFPLSGQTFVCQIIREVTNQFLIFSSFSFPKKEKKWRKKSRNWWREFHTYPPDQIWCEKWKAESGG